MPPPGKEVLFTVWQTRNFDKGLSSAGKRATDREKRIGPAELRIAYDPRPKTVVQVVGRDFTALLDTGSARSFLGPQAAAQCKQQRHVPHQVNTTVQLANNEETIVNEWYSVPLRVGKTLSAQMLGLLPGLTTDVLLGVDILAQLQITIPPPPISPGETGYPTCGAVSDEERLKKFLARELPKFEKLSGLTNYAEHTIKVKTDIPVKQRYRPRNPAMQAIIDHEVREMERAGIIEPSRSPWSSPVVIARKKDEKPRFCIDFRRVNEVSEKDAYPLPQVATTLEKLREAKVLSIDLKQGYWQVPLAPKCRPIMAFTVPGRGLMQFRVMPFGLHSAPATF